MCWVFFILTAKFMNLNLTCNLQLKGPKNENSVTICSPPSQWTMEIHNRELLFKTLNGSTQLIQVYRSLEIQNVLFIFTLSVRQLSSLSLDFQLKNGANNFQFQCIWNFEFHFASQGSRRLWLCRSSCTEQSFFFFLIPVPGQLFDCWLVCLSAG